MHKTIKILRMALESNPESWETRRHLVELLLEEGAIDEAREILAETSLESVPENTEEELFAAENLLAGHPAQAAAFVDRALARDKGSARAHWLKAKVFLALGLLEDARRHHTTATVLDEAYAQEEFEPEAQPPMSGDGGEAVVAPPVDDDTAEDPAPMDADASEEEPALAAAEPLHSSEGAGGGASSSGSRLLTGAAVAAPAMKPTGGRFARKTKKGPRSAAASQENAMVAAGWTPQQLALRVKDHELKAKKKNRAVAVLCAGILHALIILLCLIWILQPDPLREPSVVLAMKAPEDAQQQVEKKSIAQYLPQRPSSSSASRVNVIAANTTSPLAVPEVEIEEVTDDILGAGDSFGMGAGWGDGAGGGGGGAVRFFGEEKQAKRVCYIVDYSFSMASSNQERDTRQAMLKRELIESIDKLAPSMRYTVIFFSGMPWLQGENPNSLEVIGRQRIQDVPLDVTWYDASKKNKQATIDAIQGMPLAGQQTGGGTLWMSGFRPAMEITPAPDLVYLLTDGMCQDYINLPGADYETFLKQFIADEKAWQAFLARMLEQVPSGVSVNTIAMEVAGTVSARLAELATKTGGDFSIVYEGKTYTGKRALRFGDKKYDEIQPN